MVTVCLVSNLFIYIASEDQSHLLILKFEFLAVFFLPLSTDFLLIVLPLGQLLLAINLLVF